MGPAGGHEVDGLDGAQRDNVVVAALVAHDAYGFDGEEDGEGLADLVVPAALAQLLRYNGRIVDRIASGTGKKEDIELLESVTGQIQNKCLCALGEFSIVAVQSAIKNFRADFDARVES